MYGLDAKRLKARQGSDNIGKRISRSKLRQPNVLRRSAVNSRLRLPYPFQDGDSRFHDRLRKVSALDAFDQSGERRVAIFILLRRCGGLPTVDADERCSDACALHVLSVEPYCALRENGINCPLHGLQRRSRVHQHAEQHIAAHAVGALHVCDAHGYFSGASSAGGVDLSVETA